MLFEVLFDGKVRASTSYLECIPTKNTLPDTIVLDKAKRFLPLVVQLEQQLKASHRIKREGSYDELNTL